MLTIGFIRVSINVLHFLEILRLFSSFILWPTLAWCAIMNSVLINLSWPILVLIFMRLCLKSQATYPCITLQNFAKVNQFLKFGPNFEAEVLSRS